MPYIKTSDQERLQLGFGDIQCNWGMHFCGLYETESERDEIILGFLHQGALERDLQLYCPTERSLDDFKDRFCTRYRDGKELLQKDDLFQFDSAKDLYYPNGTFSPWDMDDGLNTFYKQSQAKGTRNIRATAEMVWALEGIPGVEHLMAYESRLNYFIPGKPWISICLYNVTKFSGKIIMQVLQTHPYTISGGVITENPYFVNPDTWLADHAPQFLRRPPL